MSIASAKLFSRSSFTQSGKLSSKFSKLFCHFRTTEGKSFKWRHHPCICPLSKNQSKCIHNTGYYINCNICMPIVLYFNLNLKGPWRGQNVVHFYRWFLLWRNNYPSLGIIHKPHFCHFLRKCWWRTTTTTNLPCWIIKNWKKLPIKVQMEVTSLLLWLLWSILYIFCSGLSALSVVLCSVLVLCLLLSLCMLYMNVLSTEASNVECTWKMQFIRKGDTVICTWSTSCCREIKYKKEFT